MHQFEFWELTEELKERKIVGEMGFVAVLFQFNVWVWQKSASKICDKNKDVDILR